MTRVLSAFTSLLLWFSAATPAFGNHGETSNVPDRDNNSQGVNGRDLTHAGAVARNNGAEKLDRTEITIIQPDPSDIHCEDDRYSWDYFGLTSCEDIFDGSSCADYKLQFNLKHHGQIETEWERDQYIYIGCHEFWHTSAVGHRDYQEADSCMVDGSGNRHYDDHDHYAIDHDI